MASSWAAREEWAERVKENWAAVEVASFSQGLEKLKNVGDKLQETSKKAQSMLAPMIEDAFELKEKSSAQKELLRWSAEQRSAASEGERPAKQPVRRVSGVQSGSGSSHESPGATATAKQTALGPQSNGAAAGHENQSDVGDGDAERVEDNQLSASELRMRYQGSEGRGWNCSRSASTVATHSSGRGLDAGQGHFAAANAAGTAATGQGGGGTGA